ncbi:MAG: hypothetical protein ACLP36_17245 [Acidimicrobiales bacterium]
MDKKQKLNLIQQLIDQAAVAKGSETEVKRWSLKALSTLRVTLGEQHSFYARATTTRFSPVMVNLGGDYERSYAVARSHGVDEMLSILEAPQFEIQQKRRRRAHGRELDTTAADTELVRGRVPTFDGSLCWILARGVARSGIISLLSWSGRSGQ